MTPPRPTPEGARPEQVAANEAWLLAHEEYDDTYADGVLTKRLPGGHFDHFLSLSSYRVAPEGGAPNVTEGEVNRLADLLSEASEYADRGVICETDRDLMARWLIDRGLRPGVAPAGGAPPLSIDRIVDLVSLWIRVRDEPPSSADADHSALLRRLLSGQEPFPFIPPRRYSYPDYRLAGGESVAVGECFAATPAFGENCWIVDQARYTLIERRANDTLVLEWPEEPGSRYEVSQPDGQGFRHMHRVAAQAAQEETP